MKRPAARAKVALLDDDDDDDDGPDVVQPKAKVSKATAKAKSVRGKAKERVVDLKPDGPHESGQKPPKLVVPWPPRSNNHGPLDGFKDISQYVTKVPFTAVEADGQTTAAMSSSVETKSARRVRGKSKSVVKTEEPPPCQHDPAKMSVADPVEPHSCYDGGSNRQQDLPLESAKDAGEETQLPPEPEPAKEEQQLVVPGPPELNYANDAGVSGQGDGSPDDALQLAL